MDGFLSPSMAASPQRWMYDAWQRIPTAIRHIIGVRGEFHRHPAPIIALAL
jgi:hypothetical protein